MTDHQKDQIAKTKLEAETALESPFMDQVVKVHASSFLALLQDLEEAEYKAKIIKGHAEKIEEVADAIAKRCEQ